MGIDPQPGFATDYLAICEPGLLAKPNLSHWEGNSEWCLLVFPAQMGWRDAGWWVLRKE